MFKLLSITLMILQSCGVTAVDGLATPVDEYCFPGLCNTRQICITGQCYDPCATSEQCDSQCCTHASDGNTYCAPIEWC